MVNRGGRRRRCRGEVRSALHWMPKTLRRRELEAVDPILLALKPRQVVLNMKKPSTDHKPLLLQAVAHFLDSNGFSKTLKKFLSEAQLQVFYFFLIHKILDIELKILAGQVKNVITKQIHET